MAQEQTTRQGGGDDERPAARPTPPARNAGRSWPRRPTTCSTRSTTSSRPTPRTSSGRTCRRAASERLRRHWPASALPARVPDAGIRIVHRLPRARRAAPAARGTAAPASPRLTAAARHHHRRGDLRRRRGDGRRPAGDDGQHDRPAGHREGLRRRRALGDRHRRARPGWPSRWSGCSSSSSSTTRRSKASGCPWTARRTGSPR